MKLGFSTLACPLWTFDEIVTVAADLGYDGIEVRGIGQTMHAPDITEFSDAALAATQRRLKRLGLDIPCLTTDCLVSRPDKAVTARALEHIALARKLGVPYIRLLADQNPMPDAPVDDSAVIEAVRPLIGPAADAGVCLLLETNGAFTNTARLAGVIEAIGSDAVAALWDIHHPYRYAGETPAQTLGNLGGLVRHVHVKDSLREGGRVRYAMPGQGDVPIAESARLLAANDYKGYYSLEWVKRWDDTLEEPGIVFAQYAAFMRRI